MVLKTSLVKNGIAALINHFVQHSRKRVKKSLYILHFVQLNEFENLGLKFLHVIVSDSAKVKILFGFRVQRHRYVVLEVWFFRRL